MSTQAYKGEAIAACPSSTSQQLPADRRNYTPDANGTARFPVPTWPRDTIVGAVVRLFEERAKTFVPFDPLKGYQEALREKEREAEARMSDRISIDDPARHPRTRRQAAR